MWIRTHIRRVGLRFYAQEEGSDARPKVSLDHYRRESLKIAAMFKEELPGCEIGTFNLFQAANIPLIQ